MVALPEVIASNERIACTLPHGLVAVFIGGTSGVGEYTVKAFAKYAPPNSRVYIVGRSQDAADPITAECKQLNPSSNFEFIQADVSLIKVVDDVCRQIKSKETYINLLFESQGSMGFSKKTSEALPLAAALVLHSRLRFALTLLPLLQRAPSLRRIVSVAAATFEGPIDTSNIPGTGFPLRKMRNQTASVVTLLLEGVQRRAPDVGFVHAMPGLVKGGIGRDAEGWGMMVLIAVSRVVLEPLLQTHPEECGERHLFLGTSARYVAGRGGEEFAGVPLEGRMEVARGTDGRSGSGMYSVDNKGESASQKVEELLSQFREDGTAEKAWKYVVSDFKRITGTEVGV